MTSGEEEVNNNFFNYRLASTSGYKFNDLNGDGFKVADEPALAGWTITLTGTDGAGNTVSLVTSTDENGFYEFIDLAPGTYTISEVQQIGWIQTAPDTLTEAGDKDGGVLDGDWDIVLKSGVVDSENNFGNWQPGVCGLTPGFWGQHLWAWDGDPNTDGQVDNQGRTLASKLVSDKVLSSEDVLIPVDSNRDGKINGADVKGVLVGDTNTDGFWDAGETNVFFQLKDAQNLINSSTNLVNGDQRSKMARDAIAAQLNRLNGATADSGVTDLITGAALWLTAGSPYASFTGKNSAVTGDVDKKIQTGELLVGGWADAKYTSKGVFNGFEGTAVTASMAAWQQEKLYKGQNLSASEIHEALDDFNNCYISTGINKSTGQTLVMALAGDGNDGNYQDDRAIGFGRLNDFAEFMAVANLV